MLTRSISKKTESIKYNSVEIGNSNIVGGLSSIKRVSSQVELNDVLKLKHLPQCLIYKIDKNLKVELSDKDDFYVIDVLSLSNEIIPIFNVINEETIDNLIALLNQEEYYDCFVLSSDSSLVKDAKEKLNNIGGIIDYQDSLKNKNKLTKDEMISLRKDLHKNHASIAILPARLCFHEDIQYLYDSVVNVWSEIDNDMDSSFYQAILSGAIGVISDDLEKVNNIIFDSLYGGSMTRLPLNIAHRGLPVEAPENTIEGARLAYENGADVIELDIYLTTDNKLVVIHDSTTQRTCNVNVTVENCSLSELQEIYVNKGFENDDRFNKCKIPTFEQYLQEFKDKNVRLFVEVKSNNADIVSYARDLIEKYDMYSQISFISFDSNQLAKINECYPGSTTGLLLDQAPSSTSIHEDIVKAQKVLGSTFSTLNPRMDGYSKTAIQAALARGISIYPWTFNTQKEYLTYFYNGYSGLTGNDCRKLGQYPKSIETKYSDKGYFIGDTLNVEAEVINYDKTYNKNASIKIKSLDENADEQNQIILSKTGKKSFILCCETYINDFESYIIYSDVITIDVKEKDTSGVKNFGCQGSIVTSTGIVSLSSMLGSFIALKKKKQKIQKQ